MRYLVVATIAAFLLGPVLSACAKPCEDLEQTNENFSALASCVVGEFFADCGGTSEPILACALGGNSVDCRWFVGGAPPSPYVATGCTESDCCVNGEWPITCETHQVFGATLDRALQGWGTDSWTRSRALTVDVLENPSVANDTPFACSSECSFEFERSPCCGYTDQMAHLRVLDTVVISPRTDNSGSGWTPVVEVVPEENKARVCAYRFDDDVGFECPAQEVVCATSGTIELAYVPDTASAAIGLVGRLVAEFDTFTLTGSFEVTSADDSL